MKFKVHKVLYSLWIFITVICVEICIFLYCILLLISWHLHYSFLSIFPFKEGYTCLQYFHHHKPNLEYFDIYLVPYHLSATFLPQISSTLPSSWPCYNYLLTVESQLDVLKKTIVPQLHSHKPHRLPSSEYQYTWLY